jgi:hypothetical protein
MRVNFGGDHSAAVASSAHLQWLARLFPAPSP